MEFRTANELRAEEADLSGANTTAEALKATATATDMDPRATLLVLVDGTMESSGLDAQAQAGVLMAACALAVRRIIEAADTGSAERNRVLRHKLRKAAVGEFESKLRRYCSPLTGR
ncbi:hypothetical protein [Bradyrhizobium sp. Ec3.3]|uniref:hypothetical protein n=1 Tax=Bradyrhizobium sp. Ec3.3 TaxID=189753 RepID=UPI00041336F2|nr:hypothetical protein [Bradyrhizobium sp. Ec3.3]